MRIIPFLGLTLGALLLAACGGGGGGGSSGTGSPVVQQPGVAITAANQISVARATVGGGLTLSNSPLPLESEDRASALSLRSSPMPASIGFIDATVRRALLGGLQSRRSVLSAGARPAGTSSETQPCAVGGSLTTTFDDRDNNGAPSASDTLTLAFNQCSDTSAEQSSGTVVFTISSVSSLTEDRIEMAASLAFQHVSLVQGETSATIDGSVTFSLLATSSSVQMSLAVGSGGLTVATVAPQYSDTIAFASGMQIIASEAGATSGTVSLNGAFTATSIGGQVTVATLQAFTGSATATYPSAGRLLVTGAGGSQLRITVIDATQLSLELDAAGDGTFETTTLVPWSELRPV
ncbi:hypothetical protein [Piscinibacter sp. XHJ-5]|uniref:hypothetical protein n=1 Tax=Piscinibacter sp. XHJ-5 TaxID=3037797 RepID=UPI0024532183|nr:hypothetical protein [Piscinibacter sp. XHJ-5]